MLLLAKNPLSKNKKIQSNATHKFQLTIKLYEQGQKRSISFDHPSQMLATSKKDKIYKEHSNRGYRSQVNALI